MLMPRKAININAGLYQHMHALQATATVTTSWDTMHYVQFAAAGKQSNNSNKKHQRC